MSGHTKTGNIDTNNANAVNFFWEQIQWHTGGCRDAEVDNDHRIILIRISKFVDRFTDVLKELARDQ